MSNIAKHLSPLASPVASALASPLAYAALALGLCLGCGGITPARAQGAAPATSTARGSSGGGQG